MDKNELVIIGDVIKSRRKFQASEWENFHNSIESINNNFLQSLTIPITIYSGDSFGAICRDMISAVEIILAIQEYQQHHRSRIVLIEDHISFGIDQKNFLTLEGPALWKSKNKLTFLKKNKMSFIADLKNELMTISINTITNLIISIRNDWGEIEWAIYKKYNSNTRQKDIAKELGISQQYVSKIVNKSRIKLVKSSENNLKSIIYGIYNYNH